MTFDVIVSGVCFVDMVFSGAPRLPSLGEEVYAPSFQLLGGGYYTTAVALSRLGLRVGLLSAIGNDPLSAFLRDNLAAEGVSTELLLTVDRPLHNVTAVFSQPSDRAFLSHVDHTYEPAFVEHAVQALGTHETRALHIAALPYVRPIVEAARRQNAYISMDIGWNDAWLSNPNLLALIDLADLFMPNEKEAMAITKRSDAEGAALDLSAHTGSVVIKRGGEGAVYVMDVETVPVNVPALAAPLVVDTTGAGDNFDAGMIAGILEGRSFRESCLMGHYCGCASLAGLGGSTTSPTRSELNGYLLSTYGWQLR